MVEEILAACERIKNDRNLCSVFLHLKEEVQELNTEVIASVFSNAQGEDGIIGEAVDVILCAVDVIYQQNPSITKEQIAEVVARKIAKWERLYG